MKKLSLLALLAACAFSAQAQIRLGEGQVSAGFETNTIYYVKDKGIGEEMTPEDRFGSNNYLKVDYTLGKFSAGVQVEAYLPVLQGFQPEFKNFGLASKYVTWRDENFSVLVGDVYEQFGSGLIFRSFEDRALGFNNALEGVHATYQFGKYVSFKGMYGRPRLYMEHTGSWVRGADLSVSLADIFGLKNTTLALEGSYVNRYEALDKNPDIIDWTTVLESPNLNMYSARLNLDWKGITLRAEYDLKGNTDIVKTTDFTPYEKGNAQLVELGYNYKRLGILASFRRLESMGTLLSLYGGDGSGNVLNYVPALTRQYTYLLTNLNPYVVNPNSEIGGQIDVYYSIRSKETRYKYWNFHANFSTYYTVPATNNGLETLLWRDINVDVERQWNRNLKTTLLFSRQEWNPDHGSSNTIYASNIVVGEVAYKFNSTKSLRFELQYLQSNDDEKDWVAALFEFNMAPKWSFFVSDMYNFGNDTLVPDSDTGDLIVKKMHYYNIGFSYTKSRTRIQLSYGRNREGFVCSGGVCRLSPAYTGVNLLLTSSF